MNNKKDFFFKLEFLLEGYLSFEEFFNENSPFNFMLFEDKNIIKTDNEETKDFISQVQRIYLLRKVSGRIPLNLSLEGLKTAKNINNLKNLKKLLIASFITDINFPLIFKDIGKEKEDLLLLFFDLGYLKKLFGNTEWHHYSYEIEKEKLEDIHYLSILLKMENILSNLNNSKELLQYLDEYIEIKRKQLKQNPKRRTKEKLILVESMSIMISLLEYIRTGKEEYSKKLESLIIESLDDYMDSYTFNENNNAIANPFSLIKNNLIKKIYSSIENVKGKDELLKIKIEELNKILLSAFMREDIEEVKDMFLNDEEYFKKMKKFIKKIYDGILKLSLNIRPPLVSSIFQDDIYIKTENELKEKIKDFNNFVNYELKTKILINNIEQIEKIVSKNYADINQKEEKVLDSFSSKFLIEKENINENVMNILLKYLNFLEKDYIDTPDNTKRFIRDYFEKLTKEKEEILIELFNEKNVKEIRKKLFSIDEDENTFADKIKQLIESSTNLNLDSFKKEEILKILLAIDLDMKNVNPLIYKFFLKDLDPEEVFKKGSYYRYGGQTRIGKDIDMYYSTFYKLLEDKIYSLEKISKIKKDKSLFEKFNLSMFIFSTADDLYMSPLYVSTTEKIDTNTFFSKVFQENETKALPFLYLLSGKGGFEILVAKMIFEISKENSIDLKTVKDLLDKNLTDENSKKNIKNLIDLLDIIDDLAVKNINKKNIIEVTNKILNLNNTFDMKDYISKNEKNLVLLRNIILDKISYFLNERKDKYYRALPSISDETQKEMRKIKISKTKTFERNLHKVIKKINEIPDNSLLTSNKNQFLELLADIVFNPIKPNTFRGTVKAHYEKIREIERMLEPYRIYNNIKTKEDMKNNFQYIKSLSKLIRILNYTETEGVYSKSFINTNRFEDIIYTKAIKTINNYYSFFFKTQVIPVSLDELIIPIKIAKTMQRSYISDEDIKKELFKLITPSVSIMNGIARGKLESFMTNYETIQFDVLLEKDGEYIFFDTIEEDSLINKQSREKEVDKKIPIYELFYKKEDDHQKYTFTLGLFEKEFFLKEKLRERRYKYTYNFESIYNSYLKDLIPFDEEKTLTFFKESIKEKTKNIPLNELTINIINNENSLFMENTIKLHLLEVIKNIKNIEITQKEIANAVFNQKEFLEEIKTFEEKQKKFASLFGPTEYKNSFEDSLKESAAVFSLNFKSDVELFKKIVQKEKEKNKEKKISSPGD